MQLSLRWQLVATFLAINFLTLAVVAALDAWLAARRARANLETQLSGLVATLARETYRLDDQILSQIEGLTGTTFVLRGASGKTLAASNHEFDAVTYPAASAPAKQPLLRDTVVVNERPYFHTLVELKRPVAGFEKQTLHIFYPMDAYNAALRGAMTPPLSASLAILPFTIVVALALAQRIAAPIGRLREQVARISTGDYSVAPVHSATREVRDLSQSVEQMAGKLQELTQETRKTERLKTLSQVNASLIHQLRNALAGCRLALDLHRRKCNTPDDESLDIASRQLSQMADYINRFVQVDAPKPSHHETVDLRQLLVDVCELAKPTAAHLRTKLDLHLPAEPLPLAGDRESLRQVMTNLINNALEAASSSLHPPHEPQVDVWLLKTQNEAIFEVGDTGPGLPPEIARQLYEPFATSKPEGLGLGLFVAKTAAEAHAGRIETRRETGRTWFRVTLPLEKKTA